jgi:hypothetical protein
MLAFYYPLPITHSLSDRDTHSRLCESPTKEDAKIKKNSDLSLSEYFQCFHAILTLDSYFLLRLTIAVTAAKTPKIAA